MEETYQARLSGSPPGADHHQQQQHRGVTDERGDIHIKPHPHPNPPPTQAVPVQLPNIYVNPFPQPRLTPEPQRAAATAPTPVTAPAARMVRIGPFKFARPHPLLWISLALSMIALVLEVPKGSLPTLTGRHRALRSQERLVQERLHLLTRLSGFLPPPLATMLDPDSHSQHSTRARSHFTAHPHSNSLSPHSLDTLRFWNAQANAHTLYLGDPNGAERWWSVEELGAGASVVRSKSEGMSEREVWVLRVGDGDNEGSGGDAQLMNALTHSLLLRDKLLSELAQLRASQTSSTALSTSTASQGQQPVQEEDGERRKRERERERERVIDEREREVARREKWVIDEMRKLSDKVHSEASELTLEDRITERLKAFQRRLSRISEEREKEL